MSAISLADAQAILAKLIEVQKNDAAGAIASVSVAGRAVAFKTAADLILQINYWSRMVADLTAAAVPGGGGRLAHGRSRATFR